MKPFQFFKRQLIILEEAIRKGVIRIFPSAEEAYNTFVRIQHVAILFTLLLVCCSCGSTKMVTQTVEHVSKDTIYLNSKQYDSIYIYQERLQKDTIIHSPSKGETEGVFIKDVSIEYRYKLLRDTVKVIQRDSIPYEVTITEVKEITRPLTFYDRLTRIAFWLVVGFLLSVIVLKLKSVFKP